MNQKAFLALAILGIILVSGCIQQIGSENKEPSGERMFVETDIKLANSIWSNTATFPREYGFIQNNEVVMQLKATKYMSNTDGLMTIQIKFPEEFEILEGSTEWQGNDVSKNLNLKVMPEQKGRYEIEIIAINTANNITTRQKIIACVGNAVEEITSYCLQEVSPLETPQQVIDHNPQ